MKRKFIRFASLLLIFSVLFGVTAFADENTEDNEEQAGSSEDADYGIMALADTEECSHEFSVTKASNATCTKAGSKTYTCSKCGYSYQEETDPALGHNYTGKTTKKTTFTSKGTKTYTCSRCGDSYTESIAKTVPAIKSVKAKKSGIKVSWGKLDGAKGYAVFRKTGKSGKLKRIATTTGTSYEDKSSLSGGKKYYYVIRAYKGSKSTALSHTYSSSYWSGKSKESGFTYTKTPELDKITNTKSGVKLTWNKVSGAKGYAVLRKTKNGSYKQIATTTKRTYTDKTAKSGKTYYYTVRAYRASKSKASKNTYDADYWSGYESGLKARFLKTPSSLKVTKNSASSRIIKWKGDKNASGYAVYRKKGKDGSWKMVGTTSKTSYTDNGSLVKGQKYYYTVRAYKGSAKTAKKNKYSAYYWSAKNKDGVKITAKGTGKCTSAEALAQGAVYESGRTSGGKLTRRKGVVWYHGHRETYYSQKVLSGSGLHIPGRHVNSSDQTVRDKNNFICVASTKYKRGTIVETSLGLAKVYDSGCRYDTIDIYTNW